MGKRIPLRGGEEYDALTKARRFYQWRPGALKDIKRGYNKRFRKAWKTDTEADWAGVRIVSNPRCMGGEPCFEGTRIPEQEIRNYMSGPDGYDGAGIIRLYPSLAGLDLDAWFANA